MLTFNVIKICRMLSKLPELFIHNSLGREQNYFGVLEVIYHAAGIILSLCEENY